MNVRTTVFKSEIHVLDEILRISCMTQVEVNVTDTVYFVTSRPTFILNIVSTKNCNINIK